MQIPQRKFIFAESFRTPFTHNKVTNKMKILFIAFSLMCLMSLAYGQEKIIIRGIVKTEEGKPMANASVTLF